MCTHNWQIKPGSTSEIDASIYVLIQTCSKCKEEVADVVHVESGDYREIASGQPISLADCHSAANELLQANRETVAIS